MPVPLIFVSFNLQFISNENGKKRTKITLLIDGLIDRLKRFYIQSWVITQNTPFNIYNVVVLSLEIRVFSRRNSMFLHIKYTSLIKQSTEVFHAVVVVVSMPIIMMINQTFAKCYRWYKFLAGISFVNDFDIWVMSRRWGGQCPMCNW